MRKRDEETRGREAENRRQGTTSSQRQMPRLSSLERGAPPPFCPFLIGFFARRDSEIALHPFRIEIGP